MGAYPDAKLMGNARIEAGKLVLDGKGSYMVTPPTVVMKPRAPAGADRPCADAVISLHPSEGE